MTSESRRTLRIALLAVLLAAALLPLSACSSEPEPEASAPEPAEDTATAPAEEPADTSDEAPAEASSEIAWANIELTDVETGETFTISEFEGGPVLVQAFAVW
jgi:hypothetical protein